MSPETKINVLVIDDEADACVFLCRTLSRAKFIAETCVTAELGLDYLAQYPQTEIVLLDINLGSGKDGISCLKDIKNRYKYVQVIMLTGTNELNTAVECMKIGAYDYMTKPFEMNVFIEKSKGAMENRKLVYAAEQEKLSLATGMMMGVSHQVNNRLAAFSSDAYLQIKKLEKLIENNSEYMNNSPEFKKMMEHLFKTAKAITTSVTNTGLSIKGIEKYVSFKMKGEKLKSIHLKAVIDNAVSQLETNRKYKDLKLHIEPFDPQLEIYAAEPLLGEAVYGVLQNAVEAVWMKKNKSEASQYISGAPDISFAFSATPDSNILKISDTGIGITDEDRHKVFAPYFTTKPSDDPGIGTALYVIRQIIENDHKGKLLMESIYGIGTTCLIKLPKAAV